MDILRFIDRYFDAWNSHHPISLVQVIGPGGVLHNPLTQISKNSEEIALYARCLWQAFPDFFLQTQPATVDRHEARIKWTLRGTHRGDLLGHPPTERRLTLRGLEVIGFGRPDCPLIQTCYDLGELWRQLELPNEPPTHYKNIGEIVYGRNAG